MHITFRNMIILLALGIAADIAIWPDQADGNSDLFNACTAQCAPLEGEARARCINTCMRTKKKNRPVGENAVKQKMKACEDRCASYQGLERVRCIRICLDIKSEQGNSTPHKIDAASVQEKDICESRCAGLSGVIKEKCVVRCKRKTKFDGGTSAETD
ncbi:MAG: hypothetical protein JXA07_09685 [Spirochaetes bacterium]|nr:hypothetical protein [Spirochaetota bacterium]